MLMQSQSMKRAKNLQPDPPFRSLILQRKCDICPRKRHLLRRLALTNSGLKQRLNYSPPIVQDVLHSPGMPLDPTTCAFMEPRFGRDFSRVRVHTGPRASESARAVDALAYTVGQDVVFKEGQYNPGDARGRALLAHELAHVGQQEPSAPSPRSLTIGEAHSASERQAADVAAQALDTGQTEVQTQHTPVQIARQPAGTASSPAATNPNRVNIIRVSCESNTIEFDTDAGVFVYHLTDCDIEDADYMATVTVEGNNVNFSPPPDSPGANARFPYRIEPGQPNPSTFFSGQRTVHIVTARLAAPTPSPGTPPATPFKVCARKLQISPYGNHAYIEAPPFRYAIISPTCPSHWYDNPVTGTGGQKWDNSPDPCGKTPTCLDCIPLPGVTDVGRCLRDAFLSYNNPSLYKLLGPNSNTFAGTLARRCCAGMVPKPAALGWVPGWDDSPASARPVPSKGCPPGPTC